MHTECVLDKKADTHILSRTVGCTAVDALLRSICLLDCLVKFNHMVTWSMM